MKKLYHPTFFLPALFFAAHFLSSCRNSDNAETKQTALQDSLQHILAQEETDQASDDPEVVPADSLTGPGADYISSLALLHRRLSKKPSHFVIKTNRDTVIRCRDGAILAIPANAFLNATNQSAVTGEVKLQIREFYKTSEMVMAGLVTRSNRQLLETAGMLNIKATSGEKKDSCVLKPGKSITIALPGSDSTLFDRMQVFNGQHDSTGLNWVPQNGAVGVVQTIRFKRDTDRPFLPYNGFVFPDKLPKTKPHLEHGRPEDLRAEIVLSLRDLMRHVGVVTEKARGYIDTSGTLHIYKLGGRNHSVVFPEIYSTTRSENMAVHLAVDAQISYRSHLNHDYYQKLFKMGKGNPDSLVTLTATLNPVVKMVPSERMKADNENAITIKDYRRQEKYREQLMKEYEKKIQSLRLRSEEALTRSQSGGTADLRRAQDYLMLSTPRLGWINCDRFYNAQERVDYFVKAKEESQLMLVFRSIRSIMAPDRNGVFHGVPLNARATIVGIRTEKGQLQLALQEATVSKEPFVELKFKPVTVKEYKASLERLNGL